MTIETRTIREVKSWMRFFGWEQGGTPGDVKRSSDGLLLARAGDGTWVRDIEDALDRIERQEITDELERRDREGG
jgi:hypothetical protein